jgi:hypothetical protein
MTRSMNGQLIGETAVSIVDGVGSVQAGGPDGEKGAGE